MDKHISFKDLKILSLLDQTHQNTTKVYLVKFKDQILVCKAIMKSYLNQSKRIEHLKNQKQALQYFTKLGNPHINQLICTFKDQQNAYFLLKPALGLPLHKLLKMSQHFKQQFVSLIVTQIAFILQQFHENGFIYRDVKASNFMIDQFGRITMIDLGKAKKIQKQRTYTYCGTIHAMPPEIISRNFNEGYSYQFDHYSYGILFYQLLMGKPPFGYEGSNVNIQLDIAVGINQKHLEGIKDITARNVIRDLLQRKQKRLGSKGGFKQILQHQYFKKLNLQEIKNIYNGKQEQLGKKYAFNDYKADIEDFGVDPQRYQQISKDDPFYNF